MTIKKAERTGYKFANTTPEDRYLIEGKSFDNPFSNGIAEDSADIQYEVVEATAKNAAVDENGRLTYDSVGSITVKATKPEDDCYKEVFGIYTVTILKKSKSFKFKAKSADVLCTVP